MRTRTARLARSCLAGLLLTGGLRAHDVNRSESTIVIDGAIVRVRFAINLLELTSVDGNGDGRVSYEELDAAIERVFAGIKQHYVLAAPGAPTRVTLERQEIRDDHMLWADLAYTFDRPVGALEVQSSLDAMTSPTHVHHVRATIDGELSQALLTPANRRATLLVGGVTVGRVFGALLGVLGVAGLIAWRTIQRRPLRRHGDKRV